MNFFERLFGKKEDKKEKLEALNMNLKDLDDFLDKKLEDDFKSIDQDIRKIYSDIKISRESLQHGLALLEKVEFKGPLDPPVMSAVVGKKNSFIHKMNQMVKEFERPVEFNFNSILDFHNRCVFSLNSTNAKTGEDYRYLKEFFDKEVSQVISDFKNLDRSFKELGNLLKTKKEDVDLILSLKEKNNSIKMKLESKEKMKIELGRRNGLLSDLRNKETSLGNEINGLNASDEWIRLTERKKEKSRIENEINDRVIEVVQTVSPLEQVLRKFKKLVEYCVVNFQNRRFVELYINSPMDAFAQDEDLRMFYLILEEIKKTVNEGKMELKDKILSLISHMLEEKKFLGLKKDFEDLIAKRDKIQSEISQFKIQEQKEKLERDLLLVKNNIADNSRENEILNKKLQKIGEEMNEDKSFMEDKLTHLKNQKVSISF